MKNKISTCISAMAAIALFLCISAPAFAETVTSPTPWTVTFTSSEEMDCNFSSDDVAQLASDLQPGDTAKMAITLKNANSQSTDWYMTTQILRSLEETSQSATGGAYSYTLSYTGPDGKTDTFFSSDTVGGEGAAGEDVGLHEVSNITDEYFLLGTLTTGQEGLVQLDITLDGETQGNSYQDTLADLSMDFAVELTPPTGPDQNGPRNIANRHGLPQTGDTLMGTILTFGGIAVLGLLVLVIALIGRGKRRNAERGGAQR